MSFFTRSRVYLSAEQNVAIDRVSDVKLIVSQSSRSKSRRVDYAQERSNMNRERDRQKRCYLEGREIWDVPKTRRSFRTSQLPKSHSSHPSHLVFQDAARSNRTAFAQPPGTSSSWLLSFPLSMEAQRVTIRSQLGVKRLY